MQSNQGLSTKHHAATGRYEASSPPVCRSVSNSGAWAGSNSFFVQHQAESYQATKTECVCVCVGRASGAWAGSNSSPISNSFFVQHLQCWRCCPRPGGSSHHQANQNRACVCVVCPPFSYEFSCLSLEFSAVCVSCVSCVPL